MMRSAFHLSGTLIGIALVGCATATPTVELEPVMAQPDVAELPLEWFVQNWGPFDVEQIEFDRARQLPLLLLDGRQVVRATPGRSDMPEPLASLTEDDIRKIQIVKGHSGAGLFGEAGCGGVIMIFTHDYDGPMPIVPMLESPPPCRPAVR